MRSFILTIFLVALCSLSLSAALAQNPPPPPATVSAPEVCPEVKSVQTKTNATKVTGVTVTTRGSQTQVQNPPPAPPVRPAPQVKPTPKPTQPKIKLKVGDHDEDEDSDSEEDAEQEPVGPPEQTAPASSDVVVSLCGGTSNVLVRGWDRNEVHASVDGGESVELIRFGGDERTPAAKIEVLISSGDPRHGRRAGTCHSTGDIRLEVPRGAVLDIRTNQGDVDAADVARVRIQSMKGSVMLRNITRSIDATSFNGDVSVEKSKGSINLSSISGDVDVRDVEQSDGGDALSAKSVNQDVSLADCKFGRVDASSVTGDVVWTGGLASGGRYQFATTNGDIMLVMPANSSFRVSAQAAMRGSISTDFTLRSQGETSFDKIAQAVTGVYGTGSAQLEVTTFNGSIRLRKK